MNLRKMALDELSVKSEQLEKENESIHLQHVRDCKKEEHLGEGYLHSPDDDSHYDVDGLAYCGKCHSWLG